MPKVGVITPPLKWHGGKHYLAKKIIALMPPHLHYVEPYFGGGAVLLQKDPEGVSEVINDLNLGLTNFWKILQHPSTFEQFIRIVQATPFSEVEYNAAEHTNGHLRLYPCVHAAVAFFITCRQSRAGLGEHFANIVRARTKKTMNENVSAWLGAVEGLEDAHNRLKRVVILCRKALSVIKTQDSPDTVFYCDPPYLHSTRSSTGEYQHEMDDRDHEELLCELRDIEGKFLLSGYRSQTYDKFAEEWGWSRHDFEIANMASGGKEKRRMIESVWCNF